MSIVFYEKETEEKAKVVLIHNQPKLLSEKKKKEGIELEEIPEAEKKEGKKALPYINPKTKEFWYEYVDRPLNDEEKLEELEESQKDQDDILTELLLKD